MGRETTAYAGLLLDNHETTALGRKRVVMIFDSDITQVHITRKLTWKAPAAGEAMVVFYTSASGSDWYCKKYLGHVHRGDVITCRRGIQAGDPVRA